MHPLTLLSTWALAAAALVTSSVSVHDHNPTHADGEWPASVPHHNPPHVNGQPSAPVHDHNPTHGTGMWPAPVHDYGPTRRTPGSMSASMVHQFPNNTWIENLAVRSNGWYHLFHTLFHN